MTAFFAWCVFAPSLAAQQESSIRLVTITSARPSKGVDGSWLLRVAGECPLLPAGTVVDLEVTWHSAALETFQFTSGANERFDEEFKLAKSVVVGEPLGLRTVVRLENQKGAAKEAILKDATNFPAARGPWTDHHFQHAFQLGTEEEIGLAQKQLVEFFQSRYLLLLEIDDAVASKAKAAIDERKGDFIRDGKLDAAAWRVALEKDLARLRGAQKEIAAAFEKATFRSHRQALMNLQEISSGVARRVVEKSKELFAAYGVEPAAEDREPADLDIATRVRAVPKGSYLNSKWKEIEEDLGIAAKPREESK